MNKQPGYRFVTLCCLVLVQLCLRYIGAPIALLLLIWFGKSW